MNVKNFLIAGIVGGIVDWLLGWLFYGILFNDNFGGEDPANMLFITLGCLTYGLFMSYVFVRWANIRTATNGLKAGAIFGIFSALQSSFFANSDKVTPDYQLMVLDIGIMIVISCAVGAVIGIINGKMK